MKPSKLKQLFESCPGGLVGKINYFWQKSEHLITRHIKFGEMSVKQNKAVLEASYHIAFRIGSAKQPHTIGICNKK